MQQIELNRAQWTEIVPAGGAHDMRILPVVGSCHTSLLTPGGDNAAILASPLVSLQGDVWTRKEVAAGIPVFAKAIDGNATVSVSVIER